MKAEEADKIGLAPSLEDVRTSIDVAPDPTGGHGYALNERGQVPIAAEEGQWVEKISVVSVDIPSTAAATGGTVNVTIPGLRVGDYCFFVGTATAATRQFDKSTRSLCVTENTIVLDFFNMTAGTVNPAADDFLFRCIHRFL